MTCVRLILMTAWMACGTLAQGTAEPPPARLRVDATSVRAPLEPFWASVVFHPTEYLSTAWGEEHIALLRESGLALQYVRIYNQPEDAAYLREDGSVGYRWGHFDRRADLILEQGLKPSVAFFSMPAEIAADPELLRRRPFLGGKPLYLGLPRDFSLWQEMVTDFTRHVVERYGEDEVATWRFICWNEPDLGGFSRFELDEYNPLYDHFAAGVCAVSDQIPIGGPSLSSRRTFDNPDHFRNFLEHIVRGTNHATGETGAPIDFLTIHTYGGHGAAGSSRSPYPCVDYLLEQQLALVAIRDEFPELRDVPIAVAEWGVTSSGGSGIARSPLAEVRNSQFAPAFLVTTVARLVDLRLEQDVRIADLAICLSGYEIARNADFEGKRTASTLRGFDKPLLNGYRMLARLGEALLDASVEPDEAPLSVIAARDGDGNIAVVVAHFRNDHPDNLGPDTPVELDIETHWPDGTPVMVHHWRVDEHHSNAYTVFRALGAPDEPSEAQIVQIKERMGLEPLDEPRTLRVDGPVRLEFALPCNAVSLIELTVQHEEPDQM